MKNILELLENTTRKFKNKTAVIYENEEMSYHAFQDRCQRVGSQLSTYVGVREPVIVLMDKSIEALSACLGCAYAGAYYVNITSDQPIRRILEIIEVTQAKVIIVESLMEDDDLLKLDGVKIVEYPSLHAQDADHQKLDLIRDQSVDTDPLYCNFTSGSTGKPKGVLVSHRSVIDFMNYFPETFGFTEDDVFANQAPLNFDVSIKDIFSSFKVGATLLLIPKKYFSIVTKLLDYLDEHNATVLIWAVSALCMIPQFRGFKYKTPSSISKMLFSGEVMPNNHLKAWHDAYPDAQLTNLYGPTEITCNCTYYIVPKDYDYQGILPIGKPFSNEKIIVLDSEYNRVTERNKNGELYVSGSCLALGYVNNEELTRKTFIQNPLHNAYPETVYKTGDLVHYDENGNLVFAGRADFQIKHMGFRIELEDIEHGLQSIEGVSRAMCHYDEKKSKITAYIISTKESAVVKVDLMKLLPAYMIPAQIYEVDAFPLTDNGKINRALVVETFKESKHEKHI